MFRSHQKNLSDIFGGDFWYSKPFDEIVHDLNSDPMPENSSSLIEKMSEKLIVILTFYNRYFQSNIWTRAIVVNKNIVCKSIRYNKKVRRNSVFRIRIWGLDYEATLLGRWMENGLNIHVDRIFFGKHGCFQNLSLNALKGFSYPSPVTLESTIGLGFLCVIGIGLSVLMVWLVTYVWMKSNWSNLLKLVTVKYIVFIIYYRILGHFIKINFNQILRKIMRTLSYGKNLCTMLK